jgi:hypothetical protein
MFFVRTSLTSIVKASTPYLIAPNPMKLHSSISSLLLTLAITSCTGNFSLKDSDKRHSHEQDLGDVTELKVSGIFNLYLSQGDKPSIHIDGDEDLVKKLKVNQNGESLELKFEELKNTFFGNSKPDVYLTLSDLKVLEFDGVGNFKSQDTFKVDEIRMEGNGVGDILLRFEAKKIDAEFNLLGNLNLEGSADEIHLSNEGIGNIEASKLQAKSMTLVSSGIGKVSVHCTGELSITINGIGTVSYTGNPTVIKEEINGIGKVNRN